MSPQELARDRHADLLREATQERLAAVVREGAEPRRLQVTQRALRWMVRSVSRRPAALHTA